MENDNNKLAITTFRKIYSGISAVQIAYKLKLVKKKQTEIARSQNELMIKYANNSDTKTFK